MKDSIQSDYGRLLNLLQDAKKSLNDYRPDNDDVTKYIDVFRNIISQSVDDAQCRIDEVKNCMVWDRLVIAFFGATNAGKSTIIETLRIKYDKNKKDADGTIVGTGQPDFTETFDEYDLDINGTPITLIDMPGILNDEEKYVDKIQAALDKAHIVMYVYREDTKPDELTVKKIKSYLNDWVKVYTIYNASGFKYSPDDNLITDQVVESQNLIVDGFRKALGETYEKNITMQGFAALASMAKFPESRKDLLRRQACLIDSFKSDEKLYLFSKMSELENFIREKSIVFVSEIVDANKRRLTAITKQTRDNIKTAIENQEKLRQNIPVELRKFRTDVNRYFNDTDRNLTIRAHSVIKENVELMRQRCNYYIDKGYDDLENRCNYCQEYYIDQMKIQGEVSIKQVLKTLKDDLNRRRNKLKNDMLLNLEFNNDFRVGGTRVNFSGAANNMKFNLNKTMDILEKTAAGAATGAGIGVAFGAIGAIPGAIGGGISGLLKGLYDVLLGGSYKKKAKVAIDNASEKLKNEFINSIDESLLDLKNKLSVNKENILNTIDEEIRIINRAEEDMKALCLEMANYQQQIESNNYGQI